MSGESNVENRVHKGVPKGSSVLPFRVCDCACARGCKCTAPKRSTSWNWHVRVRARFSEGSKVASVPPLTLDRLCGTCSFQASLQDGLPKTPEIRL